MFAQRVPRAWLTLFAAHFRWRHRAPAGENDWQPGPEHRLFAVAQLSYAGWFSALHNWRWCWTTFFFIPIAQSGRGIPIRTGLSPRLFLYSERSEESLFPDQLRGSSHFGSLFAVDLNSQRANLIT